MGEVVHELEQQLVDGHWVLSFESPRTAEQALRYVTDQANTAKGLIREVLQPLS